MCDDDWSKSRLPSSSGSSSDCLGPFSKRRSKSLSSTILDYYNRFGQNRDLEKYFRYRNNHSHHHPHHGHRLSSDESCLPPNMMAEDRYQKSASASQLPLGSERSAAGTAASGEAISKVIDQRKAVLEKEWSALGSPRTIPKEPEAELTRPDSEDRQSPVGDIKKKKSSRSKKGSNMTSTIEINMNVDMGQGREKQREYLEHSGTQTSHTSLSPQHKLALKSDATTDTIDILQKVEEVVSRSVTFIEPNNVEQVEDDDAHSTPTGASAQPLRPTSADSSIVSMGMPNKPRLEWDSLGDVGYDKSAEPNSSTVNNRSSHNMSTFERATLRKFFAERGLVFDDNLAAIDDPKLFGAKLREMEGQNETREDEESTLATTMTGGDDGIGGEEIGEPTTDGGFKDITPMESARSISGIYT